LSRRRVDAGLLAEGECLCSQHPFEILVGERGDGYPAAELGEGHEDAAAPGIRPEAEGVGLVPTERLGVVRRRQGSARAVGPSYFSSVRRGFLSLGGMYRLFASRSDRTAVNVEARGQWTLPTLGHLLMPFSP